MEKNEPAKSQSSCPGFFKPRRHFTKYSKGLFCIVLIFSFAIYRIVFSAPKVSCIYDAYHQSTISSNRDLVVDRSLSAFQGNNNQLTIAGKGFIGAGQVIMDLSIFSIGLLWLSKLHNMRVLIAMGLFYLIRGTIFLNIQKFPFPQFMAWRSPGFFSFTVPYEHTRDFFFSGHTGGITIIFTEMYKLRFGVPGVISFLALIFMMNMLLLTRVHYSIDIIAGFLFAIWFYRISERILYYTDRLFSLPYVFGRWVIDKCLRSQEDIEIEMQIQQEITNYKKRRSTQGQDWTPKLQKKSTNQQEIQIISQQKFKD